jgi:hypothetical protein
MDLAPWFGGTFQVFIEAIQAFTPETAMEIEPIYRLAQARRIEAAGAKCAVALLRNEARPLQHTQVPRDRRQRNVEGLCDLADIRRAARQTRKDRAPGRVGEGGKRGVEGSGVHLTNSLINKVIK